MREPNKTMMKVGDSQRGEKIQLEPKYFTFLIVF